MTLLGGYVELQRLLTDVRRRVPTRQVPAMEAPSAARAMVAGALDELPARWRSIISRCDLAGELHANVAADLGISKRHFYREREKALALFAKIITESAPSPLRPTPDIDGVHIAVTAVVRPLLNTRRVGQAVAVLEEALHTVTSAAVRVRLLLNLCMVYCQLRELRRASATLDVARQELHDAELDSETRQTLLLEFAAEEANLLRYRDNGPQAKRCLLLAIRQCVGIGLTGPRAQRALADVHLALANLLGTQNEYAAAVGHGSEAERLLRDESHDIALRSRTMTQVSSFRFFGGLAPSQVVLPDLQYAFAFAELNGFAMDALQAATALSFLHSFAERHKEALSYGQAALQVVQTVSMRDELVTGAHYTVASAQVAAGNLTGATESLRKLHASQAKHPSSVFPFTTFLRARILTAGGRDGDALRCVQAAARAFEGAGSIRAYGAALQLRASIEDALGERRKARDSVDLAIALLERGAPAAVLSIAHALAAQLTGDRKHHQTALALAEQAALAV